jgi:hypothetical protein
MQRLIAFAASAVINAVVLSGLGWNVQSAPAGTVEVTEWHGTDAPSIQVAAVHDLH